ncbi:hypothetical protein HX001_14210 [Empedobacter brevis]|uniref:Uncharacterized protein n=1 Tax=Empedobacter brevis TaxID=247 RepID=A0AAJ1V8Q3_9FLAO|nr:hypothetical protein [Empedobacter brevis]MDM1073639.1 hypothetical protein [Empedobacter brevis]
MIKQNPFSFYDFLGYFIPGAITLLLILLFLNIGSINDYNSLINVLTKNEEFQIDKFMFFVIISYSIGHFVNYLSAFTIEKYSYWRFDYPAKYLLNIAHNGNYFSNFEDNEKKRVRFSIAIFILPIFILDEVLKLYKYFKRELDDLLIRTIKQKTLILFKKLQIYEGDNFDNIKESDFQRLISHYTFENSNNHSSKLSNYVALFGFLRCMCFISVISFWIYVYYLCSNVKSYFNKIGDISLFDISIIKFSILIGITIVCYIYFMAFIKFYRRYTLETYMIIAIDKDLVEEV